MIKVMIVDDEVLQRNKLRQMIDWKRHGFTICMECSNGLEAISCIEEVFPDIVIFDVSMPKMNGVELSRHISKNYPFIKMLAISSYDDYDFVREIMKNGAKDYLLKHQLNSHELLYFLHNVASGMNHRDDNIKFEEVDHSTLNERLLLDLVNGRGADMDELLDRLNIDKMKSKVVMAILKMTNFMKITSANSNLNSNKLSEGIFNLTKSRLSEYYHGVISRIDESTYVILFDMKNIISERELQNKVAEFLADVKLFYNKCYNINSDAIWSVINNNNDLKTQYEQLQLLRNKNKKFGTKKVYFTLAQEERVLNAINMRENELISDSIDIVLDKYKEKDADYESYVLLIDEFLKLIKKIVRDNQLKSNELDGLIKKANETKYIDKSINVIKSIFNKITQMMKSDSSNATDNYILAAQEYIKNNYHNSDLSLTQTSESIGISAQYLSKLFSQQGLSYVDYVNYIRIEKSKLLMHEGDSKAKEIGIKCGFNSYNHFYKVFRNLEGMSPREYIKSKI